MNNQLDIASATGVDLRLIIAGPGARSFAFVIDWHIRLLLALAWLAAAIVMLTGGFKLIGSEDAGFNMFLAFGVAPALAIYALYHPVLEILMRGRTPGKRMAGVRVTTTEGQVPSTLAHLIRNLMRLLDSLPAAYVVGLCSTLLTRNAVRIGDLAAGTVLAYEVDAKSESGGHFPVNAAAVSRLGLENAELCQDLLDRWHALEDDKRRQLATRLLQRLTPDSVPAEESIELRDQLADLLREKSES